MSSSAVLLINEILVCSMNFRLKKSSNTILRPYVFWCDIKKIPKKSQKAMQDNFYKVHKLEYSIVPLITLLV